MGGQFMEKWHSGFLEVMGGSVKGIWQWAGYPHLEDECGNEHIHARGIDEQSQVSIASRDPSTAFRIDSLGWIYVPQIRIPMHIFLIIHPVSCFVSPAMNFEIS